LIGIDGEAIGEGGGVDEESIGKAGDKELFGGDELAGGEGDGLSVESGVEVDDFSGSVGCVGEFGAEGGFA